MIRRLIVAALLFGLITGLVWIYWINVIDPPGTYQPRAHNRAEARIIKKALRYHGISHLITTETRIYFERDGQEILIARRTL